MQLVVNTSYIAIYVSIARSNLTAVGGTWPNNTIPTGEFLGGSPRACISTIVHACMCTALLRFCELYCVL